MMSSYKCNHYIGEGYLFKVVSGEIWLCHKCGEKLKEEVLEQIESERELKIVQNKLKKIGKIK